MGKTSSKYRFFLLKIFPQGANSLSDFYKIRSGEGVSGPPPRAKISPYVALETWAEVRQNRQNMDFFVINLPLRGQSASAIFK